MRDFLADINDIRTNELPRLIKAIDRYCVERANQLLKQYHGEGSAE